MTFLRLLTWCLVSLWAVLIGGCTTTTPPSGTGSDSASRASTTTPLEGTFWKLTGLRDKPIDAAQTLQVPYLILQPQQTRLAGSGGCNRLGGGYTVEGDRLSFAGVVATRMACVQGMDVERAFLESLATVKRWRIDGKRMELLDEQGTAVLQFEARAPQ